MPPTGRWILIIAGFASAALALLGVVIYPLSTKDWATIVLYEIALFTGILLVLGLAYVRGYTASKI
jgi:hypothetical protein